MKAFIKIAVTVAVISIFVSCHEESLIEPQEYSKSNTEVKLNKKKHILVPEGVIAWWSGNMTTEDPINNYDGQLMNGAKYKKGFVKKAFKFNWNGWDNFSAPYMLVENAELTNNLQSFTIEMWVKLEGAELSERTRIERFMK